LHDISNAVAVVVSVSQIRKLFVHVPCVDLCREKDAEIEAGLTRLLQRLKKTNKVSLL